MICERRMDYCGVECVDRKMASGSKILKENKSERKYKAESVAAVVGKNGLSGPKRNQSGGARGSQDCSECEWVLSEGQEGLQCKVQYGENIRKQKGNRLL